MRAPNLLLVYGSLFFALMCQLFPWTGQGIILRPDFMLVVLIYWLFRAPHLCNIATAWFVGLIVDLSTGSLIGQHALAFTLTAFVALSFQRRLVLFSLIQITLFVLALLCFTRIVVLVLKLFSGSESQNWHYFWPVVSGILLWHLLRMTFGSLDRPKTETVD